MNAKKNMPKWGLLILVVVIVAAAALIFFVQRMEGHPPVLNLEMASPSIGAEQTLTLHVADEQSGIRKVWVAVLKDGQESVLLDKSFPSGGLLSGGSVREETLQIPFDPKAAGITDGKAMLRLVVRDYSWRKWGKGNQQYQEQEVLIDTVAPSIDVLSQAHYLAQGGSGLVIYRLSEDCPANGVMVGEHFYPGFGGQFDDPHIHLAMIAVDYRQGPDTAIHVTATDFAGNQSRTGFNYRINRRKFKRDTIAISDRFLNWKMPEFKSMVGAGAGASSVDTFLKVNRDLRRANYESLRDLTAQREKQLHWQGAFLRLPGAANRAGFADHRSYTYQGKQIDQQTHLGIDLASIQQSPVPAANDGKVVFADTLGIYGRTVVLDHGYGLFSMYSHLSRVDVKTGQTVAKGDKIGNTGKSGLAGGDHLHYSMLVHDTFVNPVEWWDAMWIKNNIISKLESVRQP